MKTLAIIPARGGSKGVPGKNRLPVGGVPLVQRALRACRDSGVVDFIHVTTDDPEIRDLAEADGVAVPELRPDHLADDHADIMPVIDHAIEAAERHSGMQFDTLLFTDPTTPFRRADTLRKAHDLYTGGDFRAVISVCPLERKPNNIFRKTGSGSLERLLQGPEYVFTRRQDMEQLCRLANAVYVTSIADFRANKALVTDPVGYVEISATEAITIDEELDYFLAEQVSLRYGV